LSAATVPRTAAFTVVKNAWCRWVSNNVGCPSLALRFSSGMRRTTNRPVICSVFLREVNAVNTVSATSAFETQVLVVSSKTASVYSIVSHAVSGIPAMARLRA
jgi:hypothetical protein